MSTTPDRVAQWHDEIEQALEEVGWTYDDYPVEHVLTLIHIESAGDPRARKRHVVSEFYGLLQMGRLAGIDVGLPDRGRRTASGLHGNGVLAIRLHVEYMRRYRARWDYDSEVPEIERVAAVWKGGPGTARRLRRAVEEDGRTWDEALRWIESHARSSWRIPNLVQYVHRARRLESRWHRWYTSTRPVGVIEPAGPEGLLATVLERALGRLLQEVT
jgi:hypothetical protein